jgi:hypothetical protein
MFALFAGIALVALMTFFVATKWWHYAIGLGSIVVVLGGVIIVLY